MIIGQNLEGRERLARFLMLLLVFLMLVGITSASHAAGYYLGAFVVVTALGFLVFVILGLGLKELKEQQEALTGQMLQVYQTAAMLIPGSKATAIGGVSKEDFQIINRNFQSWLRDAGSYTSYRLSHSDGDSVDVEKLK